MEICPKIVELLTGGQAPQTSGDSLIPDMHTRRDSLISLIWIFVQIYLTNMLFGINPSIQVASKAFPQRTVNGTCPLPVVLYP